MPPVKVVAAVSAPRPPSLSTLRNYGLTAEEWLDLAARQKFTCPVCLKPFGDRKLVIDHEHVAGWRARKRRKSKRGRHQVRVRVMTPDERRPYVRGILHAWCNGYVRAWLTLPRARAIVAYLEQYEREKR